MIDAHVLLGNEDYLRLEADELLTRMDRAGVETAIARPMGGELAVHNRQGNDRVLRAHKRVRGMATVNPWFGQSAIEELNRCRDLGAVAIFLHPSRQGFMPTDDVVRPILDWNRGAGLPIVFHTGSYVQSDVLAVGEVARRYPDITFIAGFGGFSDMWFELVGVLRDVANLLLDTSLIWGDLIEEIIREVGPDRLMFASAEPRNRLATVINLLERLDLPESQRKLIHEGNAKRVFKLP